MKTRAITGFFFVLVMLGSLFLGQWVFAGFVLVLATASLFEYQKLLSLAEKQGTIPQHTQPLLQAGTLFGTLLLAVLMAVNQQVLAEKWAWSLVLILPCLFLIQLFREDKQPFIRISNTALGFFYVIVPFYCFYKLGFHFGTYQYLLPLGFLLLLWSNDTGAYLIGRAFGKHKLFERVSPNKTWEGFFGGWLSALLVSIILYNQFPGTLHMTHWLVFASLISVIGTLGDLVESSLKRTLQVKDSGNLLPGHGGLLDRFDGLLLSAPFCYAYFLFVVN